MTLTDNNSELDDEVVEIMEALMKEKLSSHRADQRFDLEELYAEMEIQYTRTRDGSLDGIISQALDDWNWHCMHRGRGILSYVRRNRPTDPVEFTLADGTVRSTDYSWPPYEAPKPSPDRIAELEEVRQKLQRLRSPTAHNSV